MAITLAGPTLKLADGCWTLGGGDLCGGLLDTVPGVCQNRLDASLTSNTVTPSCTVTTFAASMTENTVDCGHG